MVGAISVHGVNGLWGVISVGLFATGEYGAGWNGVDRSPPGDAGRVDQDVGYATTASAACSTAIRRSFGLSCSIAPAVIAVGVVCSFVCFKLSALITPIRVSRETELEGLDGPEMGSLGYPDFELKGTPSTLNRVDERRWSTWALPVAVDAETPWCEATLSGSHAGCRKGGLHASPACQLARPGTLKSRERASCRLEARLATNLAFRSQKDASGLGGFPLKSEVLVMRAASIGRWTRSLPCPGPADRAQWLRQRKLGR